MGGRRRIKVVAVVMTIGALAVPVGAAANPSGCAASANDTVVGGINLGELAQYLFFFADGSDDANWQASSNGYVGDVAVDGLAANERTSGHFAYAGTIHTNDVDLGDWQDIVDDNLTQAAACTGQVTRIADLEADLLNAFSQINALPASSGMADVSSEALDGLDTTDGSNDTHVINVTSDLKVSSQITITGDAGDVFVLRWDDDADFSNGYNGEVKFQSGGAIVPGGALTPASFIHVAGAIKSSGGGENPPAPYPQGPRLDDGAGPLIEGGKDFKGGGFFTGYWLTTGAPKDGKTSSMSSANFVGGWYTLSTKFSLTSNSSGVHVAPPVGPTDDDIRG